MSHLSLILQKSAEEGWIGFDLDSTLAHYDGFKGVEHIGDPIPKMVDRLKRFLEQGKAVKIFTARASDHEAVPHIEAWCEKHLGRKLPVTNLKDPGMTDLYDDRAVQVIPNTGETLEGRYESLQKEITSLREQLGSQKKEASMPRLSLTQILSGVKSAEINDGDHGFNVKKLWGNEWLEIRQIDNPEKDISYTFLHETRCNGHVIAVLPFRMAGEKYEYLLRRETTQVWDPNPILSALTGGSEEGEDYAKGAAREVQEEAGYTVTEQQMIPLGTCFCSKSCDTIYHLFAVDLGNLQPDKIEGEEVKDDPRAGAEWKDDPTECQDPIVAMMFVRLQKHLKEAIRSHEKTASARTTPLSAVLRSFA